MFILHVEKYYSNSPCALKHTEWFETEEEALHYAERYKNMVRAHVFIENFKTHEITALDCENRALAAGLCL